MSEYEEYVAATQKVILTRSSIEALAEDIEETLSRIQRRKELDAQVLSGLQTFSGNASRVASRNLSARAFQRAEEILQGSKA